MNADATRAAELWEANADSWTKQVRAGYDIYRDVVNTPQFLALLPPVDGLEGLDIGCGEGANTRSLARLGANMHAIDVAPTFVEHASEAERSEPLGIRYNVANATSLPFPGGRFDFVTAFMSLMDVPDFRRALAEAHRVLRPQGFIQFSVLHPCFAPPHRRVLRDATGAPIAIEVARYFDRTAEVQRWKFSEAAKSDIEPFAIAHYHRTLAEWINAVLDAGFVLERLGEPMADEATAERHPVVADMRVTPLFLHVRARRG